MVNALYSKIELLQIVCAYMVKRRIYAPSYYVALRESLRVVQSRLPIISFTNIQQDMNVLIVGDSEDLKSMITIRHSTS